MASTCKNYNVSTCSRVKCSSGNTRTTINNVCVCSRGLNIVFSGFQANACGTQPLTFGTYTRKTKNDKKICCAPGYKAVFGANVNCFSCQRI